MLLASNCVCVCVGVEKERQRGHRGELKRSRWGQREAFFLSVSSSRQSLLKWLCGAMALGSSETFLCCLKRGENASLLVYKRTTATMAFSSAALLPHQNNEKVAKAESDCQSTSTTHWAGWQDGDSVCLVYNNTNLLQTFSERQMSLWTHHLVCCV